MATNVERNLEFRVRWTIEIYPLKTDSLETETVERIVRSTTKISSGRTRCPRSLTSYQRVKKPLCSVEKADCRKWSTPEGSRMTETLRSTQNDIWKLNGSSTTTKHSIDWLQSNCKDVCNCFNCDRPGHFSRNYPESWRTNSQPYGGPGNRSIPQYSHVGGTQCKNRRANGHATYLKATIGAHTVNCLLDTGSETTIIPASLVSSSDIQRTTHILTAANGTSIPLLGEVTLCMQIGELTTSIHGLMSEHIAEVMVGIDWMTTNDVVWELGQSQIRIGIHCFSLKSNPHKGIYVRRVELQ